MAQYEFKFDPLGAYPKMEVGEALWRLSILSSALFKEYLNVDLPARDAFNKHISFPINWRKISENPVTIAEDGTHSYPQDPDMKPLCVFYNQDEQVFIYPYGWVAIIDRLERARSVIARVD